MKNFRRSAAGSLTIPIRSTACSESGRCRGGIEVPNTYWESVENHWAETQTNGPVGLPRPGRKSTRVDDAGRARLAVRLPRLSGRPDTGTVVGREPVQPRWQRGSTGWSGDHRMDVQTGQWTRLHAVGLRALGLASGFKYFGTHDWYRELAASLTAKQSKRAPGPRWARCAGDSTCPTVRSPVGTSSRPPTRCCFYPAAPSDTDEQAASTGSGPTVRAMSPTWPLCNQDAGAPAQLAGRQHRSALHRLDGRADPLPRQPCRAGRQRTAYQNLASSSSMAGCCICRRMAARKSSTRLPGRWRANSFPIGR